MFDRFSRNRIADRPVMPFPAVPQDLKQRPDYERAYNQWHAQIEEWRKTLDDRLAEVKRLAAQVEELDATVSSSTTATDLDEFKSWVYSQIDSINASIAVLEAEIAAVGTGSSTTDDGFEGVLMLMGA